MSDEKPPPGMIDFHGRPVPDEAQEWALRDALDRAEKELAQMRRVLEQYKRANQSLKDTLDRPLPVHIVTRRWGRKTCSCGLSLDTHQNLRLI